VLIATVHVTPGALSDMAHTQAAGLAAASDTGCY